MAAHTSLLPFSSLDEIRRALTNLGRRFDFTASEVEHNIKLHNRSTFQVLAVRAINLRPSTKKPASPQELREKLKTENLLQKNYDTIKELHEQREEADHIHRQLKYRFGGEGSKMVKQASGLRDNIRKKFEQALTVNKGLADKHFPPEFAQLANRVANRIKRSLAGRFKSMASRRIIAPQSNGDTYFCYYFWFTDLKDDKNYSHDRFYICMCQIRSAKGYIVNLKDRSDESSNNVYVATDSRFELPGTHLQFEIFGKTADELTQKINDLLAVHNFQHTIEPMFFPLAINDVKFKNPLAGTPELQDNVLRVPLKGNPSDKNAEAAAREMQTELIALMNSLRYKDQYQQRDTRYLPLIRYRIVKQGNKKVVEYLFTLPPRFRGQNIKPSDAQVLRDHFGYSDNEIRGMQHRFMAPRLTEDDSEK